MPPPRRRWSVLALALALGLGAAGCRDPLCLRTLMATCPCSDPFNPDVTSCTAVVANYVGCGEVDAGLACSLAPCCSATPDGGADARRSADGAAPDLLTSSDQSAAADGP